MAWHFSHCCSIPNKMAGWVLSRCCTGWNESYASLPRGLWSKGMRALFTRCQGDVPEKGKMAAYTGNDLLDIHPSHCTFGSCPSVFRANVMLFFLRFFSFSYKPISSGLQSPAQREGEYFGHCWYLCSCYIVHKLLNAHERSLHTLIGNIHLLISPQWIFMCWDVGKYVAKK